MELPLELFTKIMSGLTSKDLKHLRLVCKTLAENVAPFLFTSISLSRDTRDLKRTQDAFSRFRKLYKTVVIAPLKYPKLSRLEYGECVQSWLWHTAAEDSYDVLIHTDLGYQEYCKMEKMANHGSSRKKIENLFRHIVKHGPNVRKVVITSKERVHNETILSKYCHGDNCTIPWWNHDLLRLSPLKSLRHSSKEDLERMMFVLLPACTIKIKEVIMDPHDDKGRRFDISLRSFDQPIPFAIRVSNLLLNLTKLRLQIDDYFIPQHRLGRGSLAGFLSQATNLECLFLEMGSTRIFRMDQVSSFSYSLGNSQYPRLRVLLLEGYLMVGSELLTFLSHSPDLKHLAIDSATLQGYRWEDLLDGIKAQNRLETLHMSYLHIEVESPWIRTVYIDHDVQVQRFLRHDGPNPFSNRRLDWYTSFWRLRIGDPAPSEIEEYFDKYF